MAPEDTAADIAGDPDIAVQPASVHRLIGEAVAPTLVRFAMPLLATNLLNALSGSWGAIWVSHVLGPNALTAVVNANLFMGMMTGSIMGVGSAAGIAIGQALGTGDRTAVKRFTGNAISFVVTTSIVIGALGWAFAPGLLDLIHLPAAARGMAITYLRFTCLSMPPVFTYAFLMMMLRGAGDARTPFRFSLIAILGGLVLSPILLTGAFGFPRLGIAGAAIGGLVASATALAALVIYMYVRDHPLALRRGDLHHLRPDLRLIWVLVTRGAPMAAENFIVQGAYFVLLTLVNAQGAATAAAYSGAAQLWGYVQMPSGAVAASMSAMAAVNIGAGRWDRIDKIALQGCLISGGFTLAAAALVYGFGDLPLRLFLPAGGAALEIARTLNRIVLWGWIMLAITNGLSAMVRANSAMLAPTLIYATTMWALRVPFAFFLLPVIGAAAIWWSFPLGTIGSALLALAYFRWGGWRNNQLMLVPAAATAATRA
jgi:putative MATE family efflux protein